MKMEKENIVDNVEPTPQGDVDELVNVTVRLHADGRATYEVLGYPVRNGPTSKDVLVEFRVPKEMVIEALKIEALTSKEHFMDLDTDCKIPTRLLNGATFEDILGESIQYVQKKTEERKGAEAKRALKKKRENEAENSMKAMIPELENGFRLEVDNLTYSEPFSYRYRLSRDNLYNAPMYEVPSPDTPPPMDQIRVDMKEILTKEKVAKEENERKKAEAKAAEALQNEERAEWIKKHGSDRLVRITKGKYGGDGKILYRKERTEYEFGSDYIYDSDSDVFEDRRDSPSEWAMDSVDNIKKNYPSYECKIVWVSDWNGVGNMNDPCEAVRIRTPWCSKDIYLTEN